MKKRLTWVVIVAAAVIAFGVAKNLIAQAAISGGVKVMTGLGLDIGSMDVGVLRSAIGITQLRLHNPEGFPDRYMVELPEIYVDYDLGAFFRRQVHLEEVRLHLAQFTVEKDRQGRLNLDSLKVIQASKSGPAKPAAASPAPEIAIDRLQLKVGKVVYKDYSGGGEPKVQEFAINLDERYEHITNPQTLAALIVSRTLMNTTVAKLTGVNLTALQSQVTAQLQQATKLAAEAAKDVQQQATAVAGEAATVSKEAAGKAVDASKEAAGKAMDAGKGAVESLKKALPFGQ